MTSGPVGTSMWSFLHYRNLLTGFVTWGIDSDKYSYSKKALIRIKFYAEQASTSFSEKAGSFFFPFIVFRLIIKSTYKVTHSLFSFLPKVEFSKVTSPVLT